MESTLSLTLTGNCAWYYKLQIGTFWHSYIRLFQDTYSPIFHCHTLLLQGRNLHLRLLTQSSNLAIYLYNCSHCYCVRFFILTLLSSKQMQHLPTVAYNGTHQNRAGASSFDSCIIVNLKPFQSGPKALHCRWCRPEVPPYCKILVAFSPKSVRGSQSRVHVVQKRGRRKEGGAMCNWCCVIST